MQLVKITSSVGALLDFEEWRSMNEIYSSTTQTEKYFQDLVLIYQQLSCQSDTHWSQMHARAVSVLMESCLNEIFRN